MSIRQDCIFDPGLVLYLPLHQRDGSSFMSRDAYGHLCTVTGAIWTPQGRSFDGIDDKITIPLSISGAISAEIWAKETAWDSQNSAIEKYTWTSGFNGFGLRSVNGIWKFLAGNASSSVYLLAAPSTTSAGNFHHIAATSVTGSHVLYIDGIPVITTTDSLSITDDAAEPINIGQRPGGGGSSYFNGVIDEARVYNRILSSLEVQNNYLATRWRYQ